MNYGFLKPGTLEDENIQMENWRKYPNGDNSTFKCALPANFDTRIVKCVIYIKNKESSSLEHFQNLFQKDFKNCCAKHSFILKLVLEQDLYAEL